MQGETLPWAWEWALSSLLLPVAPPAQPQPLRQDTPLSSGPRSTGRPGPSPGSRHLPGLPRPQQRSQCSPAPQGPSLGGREEENPPPKKNPPPLEYIKLCSLAPAPPFRSPWQPGSIPSPSLNPSPSSAKGGLQPLPPPTHTLLPAFHGGRAGRKSGGPQSSAPSSSVWGAPPGGSSSSGVCPPGWR